MSIKDATGPFILIHISRHLLIAGLLRKTIEEERILITEGDFQHSPCSILQTEEVCESRDPKDNALSQLHQAEVHVFSDSDVLCVGPISNRDASNRFAKLWDSYCELHLKTGTKFDGSSIRCVCHVSDAIANEIQRNIDDWISSGQDSDGNQFVPETCPHQVIFLGMMNDAPISPHAPKEGDEKCLQHAMKKCKILQQVQARALQLRRTRFWRNLEPREIRRQSPRNARQNYTCCKCNVWHTEAPRDQR